MQSSIMAASRALHLFFLTWTAWTSRASCQSAIPNNARALSCSSVASGSNLTSPIVDLAYAVHAPQITTSPDSRTYYNFSNIRYAAPPTGSLRFQLPQDPVDNRSAGVQDGVYGKICPQAYTPWQSAALVTAPPGEAESEDCLFLDVVVPEQVWNERCNTSRPVVVWIHGGGYQIGAKWGTPLTNPLGLLDRSFDNNAEGVIWIGLQYRVGRVLSDTRSDTSKTDFAGITS